MKLFLNLCVACVLALSSCHATASTSETGAERTQRTVNVTKKFKSISVSNAITVNYQAKTGSTTTTCVIEGVRDAVDRVRVEMDGDELEIYMEGKKFDKSYGPAPVVTVTGCPVASFESSSTSVINVNSAISTKGEFKADASSASIINLCSNVTAGKMEVEVSSGSIVNANATLNVSGEIEVDASSGANAKLQKTNCGELSVESSSGSIVNVGGKASAASIDVSSGSIVDCTALAVKGRFKINASSGAIVNHSSSNAVVDKSSGSIVNRK